jgi:hypothetical protein
MKTRRLEGSRSMISKWLLFVLLRVIVPLWFILCYLHRPTLLTHPCPPYETSEGGPGPSLSRPVGTRQRGELQNECISFRVLGVLNIGFDIFKDYRVEELLFDF